ncbi:CLUMA_CG003523, isoform A [Clunio marinus]|uniref:CLUMA_CG003523, isoform A n=1 Tax=Clunio marinus TaxID=568069 RepID=A0A1J1HT64_9DIPT|nr:CLUMA_CG003523, isoform A [Clunio marinus]
MKIIDNRKLKFVNKIMKKIPCWVRWLQSKEYYLNETIKKEENADNHVIKGEEQDVEREGCITP